MFGPQIYGLLTVFRRKSFSLVILALSAAAACIPFLSARANEHDAINVYSTEGLVANGGYALERNNGSMVSYNPHRPFIPASIIKIATALAAVDILGPSYRFTTSFYRDDHENLYIKGFGDPFLISEEVAAIVAKLKVLGCTRINDIYLDDSAFQLGSATDGAGWSDNPYDAQNSALAVNFNTINVVKAATGDVSSAEEQTPTLVLMTELAADLNPGVYRINITQNDTLGGKNIGRYTGELFRAFQQKENISGTGVIRRKNVPENLVPFYVHHADKTLEEIIEPLMRYSSNYIANQIFLTAGAARYGYPATWEKGKQAMDDYLYRQNGLAPEEIQIFEGSGISRKNRISPSIMMQLLDSFKPYAKLLVQEDDKLLKSGTLKGVYCYAGYFADNQRLNSFVLMLNQEENNRDKLLAILEQIYRAE